jgi:hypothetical protein
MPAQTKFSQPGSTHRKNQILLGALTLFVVACFAFSFIHYGNEVAMSTLQNENVD